MGGSGIEHRIARFDDAVLAAVADRKLLAHRKAVTAARDLTAIGGDVFLVFAGLLAVLFAAAQGDTARAATLAGFLIVARSAGWLLKAIFRRVRPPDPHASVVTFTSSFPSIHTLSSHCATTALCLAALPSAPLLGVAAGATVSLLVGFTRLVFRVHWPSDVIAGFLVGSALSVAAAVVATAG